MITILDWVARVNFEPTDDLARNYDAIDLIIEDLGARDP